MLRGIAAAQYGLSTPNAYCASVIHSFGHAIARNYSVQQGVAHAIAAVAEVRDALDLPSNRRSVEGAERDHFPDLARAVVDDPFMDARPRDLDPSASKIEAVFERMW